MYSIKLMPDIIVSMNWACSLTGNNVLGRWTSDGKIIPRLGRTFFAFF